MPVLKAGALYFVLVFVFAAGFGLGTIRTIWLVPRVGARRAELGEMPVMLVVTIVAARWTVLRLAVSPVSSARLTMGCIALVFMLTAEFGFVLWVRGVTFKNYLATRDPVSGTVYYVMLVVFALMPLLVGSKWACPDDAKHEKITKFEKFFVNSDRRCGPRCRLRWNNAETDGYASGQSYLDFGCGNGAAAIRFASKLWLKVMAVDVDPEQIEAAKENSGQTSG
jgi:type IV secretory pathway TrbD component